MQNFIEKHTSKITGKISCFDRIILKGHLPISWSDNMQRFIMSQGLLIKDFKSFVVKHSERIKQNAKSMAERLHRPYVHINGQSRKEHIARQIAERKNITDGLICVLSAVESCQSFRLAYGENRPRLINARRKCLCLYFYLFDRYLGFMHVRVPTWFPFTIQIYINGHEWLARQLDRHRIGYKKIEICR